ncbi:lysylphosphatidylglycerol synthase domain-containing protein [Streptomyces sp. NPDC017260]|uniref:lysylphosphatidylglycerol synthase domain-containing protein n=1 Tax=unclassified Streptomyces TaxID=2593676 RepID=UPI0037BB104C
MTETVHNTKDAPVMHPGRTGRPRPGESHGAPGAAAGEPDRGHPAVPALPAQEPATQDDVRAPGVRERPRPSNDGTPQGPDATPAGKRGWTALLRPLLAASLIAVAGYGMWQALEGSGHVIGGLLARDGAAPWLVGSAVVNLAGLALSMASWRSTVTGLGSPLSWGPTCQIFGGTILGKYLPGPFWSALAGVHLGRRHGVTAQRMVTAYVLNSVVVLLTAAVVGMLAAPRVMGDGAWWLLPVALALAALLRKPGVIVGAAGRAARLLRRPAPDLRIADGDLRRAVVWEVLSWLVGGAHLWMIAVVLGAPLTDSFALCVGGFALAAAAGAAVLVVPGGAGVREVVLMVVLTADLPWAQAGAVALASRVCCTVTEIAGAGAALLAAQGARRGRGRVTAGAVEEVSRVA